MKANSISSFVLCTFIFTVVAPHSEIDGREKGTNEMDFLEVGKKKDKLRSQSHHFNTG